MVKIAKPNLTKPLATFLPMSKIFDFRMPNNMDSND